MTPKQFVTELFGEDWKPSQLPAFIDTLKLWSEDAQRYYTVRDNVFNIEFTNEPNSRENIAMFNQTIDDLGQLPVNEGQ
jgi:aryl-phospho-beta-D-glucosidase BglC (GH1 family)